MSGLAQQFIHFFAALLLLLSFAMLTQRRLLSLIKLLALQGFVLSINVAFVAYVTQQIELYITVILTLFLKVWLIPFVLHRLLIRLHIQNKIEPIVNLPATLLISLALVIFAFNLSLPITELSAATSRDTLALALASVLLSLFMMIIKRKAISQVVSLLALENSLFFAASSATNGMPLVVELGMAFDVLIGLFIFGLFFFQIRDTFDSFDLHHLEKLRED
ncbi:MAG: formate hydrogenlyase [Gammaproteobacteria bacterium]|nr:formate hydrogenlyase [Gammaproteobacteria bacterium]